jgi:hypothetical protein
MPFFRASSHADIYLSESYEKEEWTLVPRKAIHLLLGLYPGSFSRFHLLPKLLDEKWTREHIEGVALAREYPAKTFHRHGFAQACDLKSPLDRGLAVLLLAHFQTPPVMTDFTDDPLLLFWIFRCGDRRAF